MQPKIRRRALRSEDGFTLIELLVVILIIGVLAAIAIPSFLNQRDKASDANAKSLVRSAQTAAETYGSDRGGTYTGLSPAQINALEPAIPTSSGQSTYLSAAAPDATNLGYSLTATSSRGEWYTITRADDGTMVRSCGTSVAGATAGGCVGGSW